MGVRTFLGSCALAVMAATVVSPSIAQQRQDNLRVALSSDNDFVARIQTASIDSGTLSAAVYDTLLYDAPTGGFAGLLATAWRWVDERTIDLDLRQGVTFHDGEPFDADDVVFTVAFAADPRNNLRQQAQDFGFLDRAEKLGPHKVRLHLKQPFPLAEHILASRLTILPDAFTTKEGPAAHASRPVGTGPYRVAEMRAGQSYVLRANPGYFDGPKPKAQIGTVTIRTIADTQTQVAEMMGGGLDMIFNVPDDLAKNLATMPNLQVAYGDTARFNFLSLDVAGRNGDTPLKDQRIRQAIAHAIDREAIVKNLVGGTSTATVSPCHPRQLFCTQDVATYRHDPARARQLLAEAGVPPGTRLSLINGDATLRPVGEAIQGYLRTVGITVEFETFTLPAWRTQLLQGKSTMSIVGWGSGGVFDTGRALPTFFNGAEGDYARDQEVVDWVTRAGATTDKAVREDLYRRALIRIAERAYVVPLFTSSVPFVVSRDVEFKPDRDTPEFVRARWRR